MQVINTQGLGKFDGHKPCPPLQNNRHPAGCGGENPQPSRLPAMKILHTRVRRSSEALRQARQGRGHGGGAAGALNPKP